MMHLRFFVIQTKSSGDYYHDHARPSNDSTHKVGNCGNWRYRQDPHDKIKFSKWAKNEGCEGDTCARMQGNGNI